MTDQKLTILLPPKGLATPALNPAPRVALRRPLGQPGRPCPWLYPMGREHDERPPMKRILHLSDLHFAPRPDRI